MTVELDEIREQEYLTALAAGDLRQRAFRAGARAEAADRLTHAEQQIRALAVRRRALEAEQSAPVREMRGAGTTGLDVTVALRFTEIPTSVYHLLHPAEEALITCTIAVTGRSPARRVRLIAYIEGYSARAVTTVETTTRKTSVHLHPALFGDRIRDLTEMTGAALTVLAEDLDGPVELHRTFPIRLLARNTVRLRDPDGPHDLTRYLGAFVTPNAPVIMRFLSRVGPVEDDDPEATVRAVFLALTREDIGYINSVTSFGYEAGHSAQRIRLPRQSLTDKQANCIDATVLMASILEALSLSTAIVVMPRHAMLAWETSSGDWRYLETTAIGRTTFEEACREGSQQAEYYDGDQDFQVWPLRRLRAVHRVYPME